MKKLRNTILRTENEIAHDGQVDQRIKKWVALRQELSTLEQQAAQIEGAINELQNQLLNEYECKDIEQAYAILAHLKDEGVALNKRFEAALIEFKSKWTDKFFKS